eukprot:TRINITY_DN3175_c0_g1_i2.p1 TRINITY_DN3175_c0_g1~~TRINITY_DN3175_c0_g1_i2.p1  ORF type:complete len:683 (+),score=93.13 TRINITY_DN3175_c0_g1_i2:83-2131(+)
METFEKVPSAPDGKRTKKKKMRRSQTITAKPDNYQTSLHPFSHRPTKIITPPSPAEYLCSVRQRVPAIQSSEISLGEKIGKGQYGSVYRGKCRGEHVAVKILYDVDSNEEILDSFRKEVEIMSHIHHPNIILLMAACTEPGNLCIVTELMGGNLHDLLPLLPSSFSFFLFFSFSLSLFSSVLTFLVLLMAACTEPGNLCIVTELMGGNLHDLLPLLPSSFSFFLFFSFSLSLFSSVLTFLVLLMAACTEPGNLCIVTELMEGNLHDLLHRPDIRLSNLQKLNFAIDIASGMAWLHNAKPCQIIHRDLKPSNLLIDENWKVKVADFGLSCFLSTSFTRDKNFAIGSARWMAPEVLAGDKLNNKLDVYSYGLILWEIFTRNEPYTEFRSVSDFRDAICNSGIRPNVHKKCIPPMLADIMVQCWHSMPQRRPSFVDILEMLKDAVADIEIGPSCKVAALFWKKSFPGKTRIQYHSLVSAMEATMFPELTDKQIHLKCFQVLVSTQRKQGSDMTLTVDITRFGHTMAWFGPFGSMPHELPGVTFLDRMLELVTQPWFFADIERIEAERILGESGMKKGSFLVRCNLGGHAPTHASPFIISCCLKGPRIVHNRVYRSKESPYGFYIQLNLKGSQPSVYSANGSIINLINHLRASTILCKKGLTCHRFGNIFGSPLPSSSQYDAEEIL